MSKPGSNFKREQKRFDKALRKARKALTAEQYEELKPYAEMADQIRKGRQR